MTGDSSQLGELCGILTALIDGEPSKEQLVRLEYLLAHAPGALDYYRRYMRICAFLEFERPNGAKSCLAPFSEVSSTNETAIADVENAAQSAGPPVVLPATVYPGTYGYPSTGWPLAYLVSALFIGLGLLLGSFLYVSPSNPIARQSAPSSRSHDFTPSVPSSLLSMVGRVGGMADCQWSDASTATSPGSYIPLGRKYVLSAGLMEINYDSGAKVILQGPCTYEVESRCGGFLALGKLTARVEKAGEKSEESDKDASDLRIPNPKHRVASSKPLSSLLSPLFAVRTPAATVTDLGTEFGVEVGADLTTKARVFAGRVQVTSSAQSGASQPRIVTIGQTVQIGNGQNHVAVLIDDEPQFVRKMPRLLYSRDAGEYAKLVLAMRPALYYRLERPASDHDRLMLFDSAPGGHHGRLTTDMEWPWLPGRFGEALFCRELGGCQAAIVPDYPKATDNQLSVAAWVMAESRPYSAFIATNWEYLKTGQFHFGLYFDDGDLAVSTRQVNRGQVFVREGRDRPFPLFQWQHVAFVCNKTVLRLYRNGVEVASAPCDGMAVNPDVPSLVIGGRMDDTGVVRSDHSWHGRIDELAVFNRAITPEEIYRLYKPALR